MQLSTTMTTHTIQLECRVWQYDDTQQLGDPGGFGAVFQGEAADGTAVAVKRLHIDANDAAHRELRVAAELVDRQLGHVVPVLDVGIDPESGRYFIVMPRADESLENFLAREGPVGCEQAIRILQSIVQGLLEVDDLVHRDLKPANVLFHDATWKIADFGIARFVEDATSARTLKDFLTPPYAAPEQWRFEGTTGKTDVYAIGCIAHKLLTGQPPFMGVSRAEFREKHLTAPPPRLDVGAPVLSSIVGLCLRKLPETRPSLQRLSALLQQAASSQIQERDVGDAVALLQSADERLVAHQADIERRSALARAQEQRWKEIGEQAIAELDAHWEGVLTAIESNAVQATKVPAAASVSLGKATLALKTKWLVGEGCFPESGWEVAAGGTLVLSQSHPKCAWSASLWYAQLEAGHEFHWYELLYMSTHGRRRTQEPFALSNHKQADLAASKTIAQHSIAFGPKAIDGTDQAEFQERWIRLFVSAVEGNLKKPVSLPLRNWHGEI